MSSGVAGRPAGRVVALLGLVLTAASYLLGAGSNGGLALAAVGLAGCLGSLAGRPGAITLIGAAAIGQLALVSRPGPAAVLSTAVLLAVLLAGAQIVESGGWRAGWSRAVSADVAPVGLGVAVTAVAVLFGLAGRSSAVPAAAATVIGVLAAAVAVTAVIMRVRRPD